MNNKLKKITLLIGDILILYLSLYLTLTVRYGTNLHEQLWQDHFMPFSIIFLVFILIFYISGLYKLNLSINNAKFLELTSRSLVISGIFSIAFFYLSPQTLITPKRNLLIFILIFTCIFFVWRQLFNWLLKSYLPKTHIAIVGLTKQTLELIKEIKQKSYLGYDIKFIIDIDGNNEKTNLKIIHDLFSIKKLFETEKINIVILSADVDKSNELRSALFNCLSLKINYISLPAFYENISGKIPVTTINKMWFLENLDENKKKIFDNIKCISDFFLAIFLLFLTLPFWIIIGFLIKIESKGPVFFKQTRIGKNNLPFTIIKFRTMRTENNHFSLTKENDDRITAFGSFLRKTRLDEIPQIINILKGEMSFIGPRPERPKFVKDLEKQIPFYRERILVKPGVTGWDQISGEYHSPSCEDTLKKLQYDLFYIKNRSIYLDLSIMLKTISTVLSKGGR